MPAASNAMRTILRTGSVVFQFSRVNPSALNPEFDLAAIAVAGNSGPSGPYRATSSQWATQSARALSASSTPLAKGINVLTEFGCHLARVLGDGFFAQVDVFDLLRHPGGDTNAR